MVAVVEGLEEWPGAGVEVAEEGVFDGDFGVDGVWSGGEGVGDVEQAFADAGHLGAQFVDVGGRLGDLTGRPFLDGSTVGGGGDDVCDVGAGGDDVAHDFGDAPAGLVVGVDGLRRPVGLLLGDVLEGVNEGEAGLSHAEPDVVPVEVLGVVEECLSDVVAGGR